MPKLQVQEPALITNALPRAFNREHSGKISGFLRIYHNLLQKLKGRKYDQITASVCARFNLRCMHIIKNHKTPQIYLEAIRTRLLPDYHASNCEAAKEYGKYPFTETFKEILILYTKMELKSSVLNAPDRITRTLMSIFYDIAEFDKKVEDVRCMSVVATIQILQQIDGYQHIKNSMLKKLAVKLGSPVLSEIFQTCEGKNLYECKKAIPMDHPDLLKIRKAIEVFNSWLPNYIEIEDDDDVEFVPIYEKNCKIETATDIKEELIMVKEEQPKQVGLVDLTSNNPEVSLSWEVRTDMRKRCNQKAYNCTGATILSKSSPSRRSIKVQEPRASDVLCISDNDDDEVELVCVERDDSNATQLPHVNSEKNVDVSEIVCSNNVIAIASNVQDRKNELFPSSEQKAIHDVTIDNVNTKSKETACDPEIIIVNQCEPKQSSEDIIVLDDGETEQIETNHVFLEEKTRNNDSSQQNVDNSDESDAASFVSVTELKTDENRHGLSEPEVITNLELNIDSVLSKTQIVQETTSCLLESSKPEREASPVNEFGTDMLDIEKHSSKELNTEQNVECDVETASIEILENELEQIPSPKEIAVEPEEIVTETEKAAVIVEEPIYPPKSTEHLENLSQNVVEDDSASAVTIDIADHGAPEEGMKPEQFNIETGENETVGEQDTNIEITSQTTVSPQEHVAEIEIVQEQETNEATLFDNVEESILENATEKTHFDSDFSKRSSEESEFNTEEGDSQESVNTVSSSEQTLQEIKLSLQKQQNLNAETLKCDIFQDQISKSNYQKKTISSVRRSPPKIIQQKEKDGRTSKSKDTERKEISKSDKSSSRHRHESVSSRHKSREPGSKRRYSERDDDNARKEKRRASQDHKDFDDSHKRDKGDKGSSRKYHRRGSPKFREKSDRSNAQSDHTLKTHKKQDSASRSGHKLKEERNKTTSPTVLDEFEDFLSSPNKKHAEKSDNDTIFSDISEGSFDLDSDDEIKSKTGTRNSAEKENSRKEQRDRDNRDKKSKNLSNASARRAKSYDRVPHESSSSKSKRSSTVDRTIDLKNRLQDRRSDKRRQERSRKGDESKNRRHHSPSPRKHSLDKSSSTTSGEHRDGQGKRKQEDAQDNPPKKSESGRKSVEKSASVIVSVTLVEHDQNTSKIVEDAKLQETQVVDGLKTDEASIVSPPQQTKDVQDFPEEKKSETKRNAEEETDVIEKEENVLNVQSTENCTPTPVESIAPSHENQEPLLSPKDHISQNVDDISRNVQNEIDESVSQDVQFRPESNSCMPSEKPDEAPTTDEPEKVVDIPEVSHDLPLRTTELEVAATELEVTATELEVPAAVLEEQTDQVALAISQDNADVNDNLEQEKTAVESNKQEKSESTCVSLDSQTSESDKPQKAQDGETDSTCTSATATNEENLYYRSGLHMLADTADVIGRGCVVQPTSLFNQDISQAFTRNYIHQEEKFLSINKKTKHIESDSSDNSDCGLTIDASTPGRDDESSRSPHPTGRIEDKAAKSCKTTDHSIMTILTKDTKNRSPEQVQKKKQASLYLRQRQQNIAVDLSQKPQPAAACSGVEPLKVRTKAERKEAQMFPMDISYATENKNPTSNTSSPRNRKRKGTSPSKRTQMKPQYDDIEIPAATFTEKISDVIAEIPKKRGRSSSENCTSDVQTKSKKNQLKGSSKDKLFKRENVNKLVEAITACVKTSDITGEDSTKKLEEDEMETAPFEMPTKTKSKSKKNKANEVKQRKGAIPPMEKEILTSKMPPKKRETRKSFEAITPTQELPMVAVNKETIDVCSSEEPKTFTKMPKTRNKAPKRPVQSCRRSPRHASRSNSTEELQVEAEMPEAEDVKLKIETDKNNKKRTRKSKSKILLETEDEAVPVDKYASKQDFVEKISQDIVAEDKLELTVKEAEKGDGDKLRMSPEETNLSSKEIETKEITDFVTETGNNIQVVKDVQEMNTNENTSNEGADALQDNKLPVSIEVLPEDSKAEGVIVDSSALDAEENNQLVVDESITQEADKAKDMKELNVDKSVIVDVDKAEGNEESKADPPVINDIELLVQVVPSENTPQKIDKEMESVALDLMKENDTADSLQDNKVSVLAEVLAEDREAATDNTFIENSKTEGVVVGSIALDAEENNQSIENITPEADKAEEMKELNADKSVILDVDKAEGNKELKADPPVINGVELSMEEVVLEDTSQKIDKEMESVAVDLINEKDSTTEKTEPEIVIPVSCSSAEDTVHVHKGEARDDLIETIEKFESKDEVSEPKTVHENQTQLFEIPTNDTKETRKQMEKEYEKIDLELKPNLDNKNSSSNSTEEIFDVLKLSPTLKNNSNSLKTEKQLSVKNSSSDSSKAKYNLLKRSEDNSAHKSSRMPKKRSAEYHVDKSNAKHPRTDASANFESCSVTTVPHEVELPRSTKKDRSPTPKASEVEIVTVIEMVPNPEPITQENYTNQETPGNESFAEKAGETLPEEMPLSTNITATVPSTSTANLTKFSQNIMSTIPDPSSNSIQDLFTSLCSDLSTSASFKPIDTLATTGTVHFTESGSVLEVDTLCRPEKVPVSQNFTETKVLYEPVSSLMSMTATTVSASTSVMSSSHMLVKPSASCDFVTHDPTAALDFVNEIDYDPFVLEDVEIPLNENAKQSDASENTQQCHSLGPFMGPIEQKAKTSSNDDLTVLPEEKNKIFNKTSADITDEPQTDLEYNSPLDTVVAFPSESVPFANEFFAENNQVPCGTNQVPVSETTFPLINSDNAAQKFQLSGKKELEDLLLQVESTGEPLAGYLSSFSEQTGTESNPPVDPQCETDQYVINTNASFLPPQLTAEVEPPEPTTPVTEFKRIILKDYSSVQENTSVERKSPIENARKVNTEASPKPPPYGTRKRRKSSVDQHTTGEIENKIKDVINELLKVNEEAKSNQKTVESSSSEGENVNKISPTIENEDIKVTKEAENVQISDIPLPLSPPPPKLEKYYDIPQGRASLENLQNEKHTTVPAAKKRPETASQRQTNSADGERKPLRSARRDSLHIEDVSQRPVQEKESAIEMERLYLRQTGFRRPPTSGKKNKHSPSSEDTIIPKLNNEVKKVDVFETASVKFDALLRDSAEEKGKSASNVGKSPLHQKLDDCSKKFMNPPPESKLENKNDALKQPMFRQNSIYTPKRVMPSPSSTVDSASAKFDLLKNSENSSVHKKRIAALPSNKTNPKYLRTNAASVGRDRVPAVAVPPYKRPSHHYGTPTTDRSSSNRTYGIQHPLHADKDKLRLNSYAARSKSEHYRSDTRSSPQVNPDLFRPLQKHDGQSAGASTSDDTSWIEGMGVFKKYLKLPENVEFPTRSEKSNENSRT